MFRKTCTYNRKDSSVVNGERITVKCGVKKRCRTIIRIGRKLHAKGLVSVHRFMLLKEFLRVHPTYKEYDFNYALRVLCMTRMCSGTEFAVIEKRDWERHGGYMFPIGAEQNFNRLVRERAL